MIRNKISVIFWYYYYSIFKSKARFTFQGKRLRYFYHQYNTTWRNERAVEIPIIKSVISDRDGRVLEIGNVLSHYFKSDHDIVDKYEQSERIIAQDVAALRLPSRYDLIISISTLEHVGWDEDPITHKTVNEPRKIPQAISRLQELVNPCGRIVFTAPLGYNPNLDKLIKNGRIPLTQQFFLKRISKDNRWLETSLEDVKTAKFNSPFPFANAIVVGIIDADK